MGPALQTRAHTPYSDPVTRVSRALSGARTRCWGLGPLHPRLLPPGFGRSRTPLSRLTPHAVPPLLHAHRLWRARTHLGHSHSASRDTRPERAHPSHTLTHACTHAHTQTTHGLRPLPSCDPRPPAAAPQSHSLTMTHLHSFTDTHAPPTYASYRHTFINRARRSTHAPLAYSFGSPESFLPPPRAPHFPACRLHWLRNSLAALFQSPLLRCVFPLTLS